MTRKRTAVLLALALLADPALEENARAGRAKLLAEKVDINDYYIAEADRLAKVGRKG